MYDLSYEERLNQLGKITLENRRHYSDMVFVYKALHGIVDCDANDFGGLYLKNSCTGGESIRLQQGWNELLLDFNYLHFERRPHGISSPLASAEVLVCHRLNICLKRDAEKFRPLHTLLTFYALLHLQFNHQHLIYLYEH